MDNVPILNDIYIYIGVFHFAFCDVKQINYIV